MKQRHEEPKQKYSSFFEELEGKVLAFKLESLNTKTQVESEYQETFNLLENEIDFVRTDLAAKRTQIVDSSRNPCDKCRKLKQSFKSLCRTVKSTLKVDNEHNISPSGITNSRSYVCSRGLQISEDVDKLDEELLVVVQHLKSELDSMKNELTALRESKLSYNLHQFQETYKTTSDQKLSECE